MNNQRNLLINLSLAIITLAFAALTYLTYTQWQQSTPPSYTPSDSAANSSLVIQLRDHVDSDIYSQIAKSIENTTHEDVGFMTIRSGSYSQQDNQISFLADESATSATYRVTTNTESGFTQVQCPRVDEQKDSSWTCGLSAGHHHEH